MNPYLKVVQQLLIDTVISGGAQLTTEAKTGLGLRILSGFFVSIGLIFVCVAAFIWLDSLYPTYFAAAVMSLIAFCLAAICLYITHRRRVRRQLEIAALRRDVEEKVMLALNLASEELGDTIKDNPKSALAVAGLAGMFVSTRLR